MMAMPDFFQLYGLPQTFHPDPALVRQQYYALSRQHHPDRFAGSGGAEYTEALRMSALNNDAYRTFSNPDRTMGYLLKLHGIVEDEEAYKLSSDFLMEMMELNEAVEDNPEDALSSWTSALADWQSGADALMRRFEEGDRSPELFAALKDAYYRKKYLMRIREKL